jgi:hypothetical protein
MLSDRAMLTATGVLFLMVATNYTSTLLSCDMQHTLREQMWAKHVVGFGLVVFLIIAVDRERYVQEAEEQKTNVVGLVLRNALLIYLFFVILTRARLVFNLIVVVCILTYMLLDIEIRVRLNAPRNAEGVPIATLIRAQYYLIYLALAGMVVGFIDYFLKQRRDKGTDFRFTQFLFGVPHCQRFSTI